MGGGVETGAETKLTGVRGNGLKARVKQHQDTTWHGAASLSPAATPTIETRPSTLGQRSCVVLALPV